VIIWWYGEWWYYSTILGQESVCTNATQLENIWRLVVLKDAIGTTNGWIAGITRQDNF
jgi:hypothetical protein